MFQKQEVGGSCAHSFSHLTLAKLEVKFADCSISKVEKK